MVTIVILFKVVTLIVDNDMMFFYLYYPIKAFGISESVKNNFRNVREPLVHSVGEVVWY